MGWATFEEKPPDPSCRFPRAEWERPPGPGSVHVTHLHLIRRFELSWEMRPLLNNLSSPKIYTTGPPHPLRSISTSIDHHCHSTSFLIGTRLSIYPRVPFPFFFPFPFFLSTYFLVRFFFIFNCFSFLHSLLETANFYKLLAL